MKLKNLFNLLALGAALTISGAGCRHTPTNTTNLEGMRHPAPVNPNVDPDRNPGGGPRINRNPPVIDTMPGQMSMDNNHDHSNWNAHPEILSAQTIHFDYDKSAIKSSEQSKLDAVADYLKGHANADVRVEGNCDERGTEEYNRSLGERRALAAREYLVRLGIDPARIETQTYGKDKPVAMGHDESAFAQNRRDEFVVLTPPGR